MLKQAGLQDCGPEVPLTWIDITQPDVKVG